MIETKFLPLSLFFFLVLQPVYSNGETFYEAPIIDGGKIIEKTEERLEMISMVSHSDAVKYYEEALKGYQDIKIRQWKSATYIEDDGRLPWHSITISKEDKEGTNIVIMKDNWTWIIGTLILRYIGVFVVLLVLFLGISLSGAIISKSVKKIEQRKQVNQ
jgi:hypothetical protein